MKTGGGGGNGRLAVLDQVRYLLNAFAGELLERVGCWLRIAALHGMFLVTRIAYPGGHLVSKTQY